VQAAAASLLFITFVAAKAKDAPEENGETALLLIFSADVIFSADDFLEAVCDNTF